MMLFGFIVGAILICWFIYREVRSFYRDVKAIPGNLKRAKDQLMSEMPTRADIEAAQAANNGNAAAIFVGTFLFLFFGFVMAVVIFGK